MFFLFCSNGWSGQSSSSRLMSPETSVPRLSLHCYHYRSRLQVLTLFVPHNTATGILHRFIVERAITIRASDKYLSKALNSK